MSKQSGSKYWRKYLGRKVGLKESKERGIGICKKTTKEKDDEACNKNSKEVVKRISRKREINKTAFAQVKSIATTQESMQKVA